MPAGCRIVRAEFAKAPHRLFLGQSAERRWRLPGLFACHGDIEIHMLPCFATVENNLNFHFTLRPVRV
jgi:hypothetical protein